MITDSENRYDDSLENPNSNRDGMNDSYNRNDRDYNREDGGNRPYSPRFSSDGNNRSYRPRFNNSEGGNSYRPRFNGGGQGGERPYRPRFNGNSEGNDRPYTPRYNNGEGGDRPYRPRFNNGGGQGGDRPYRPRFNGNSEGNDRPYTPRYNNNGDGGDRPYRPRFNNGGGQGGDRPYRPRFNSNEDGDNRSYRPGGMRPRMNSRPQGGFTRRPSGYNPNDKYSKKKQIEYKDILSDPNEPIRLNKFLANAGICSRREADEFITAGVVSVNGEVVTELGTKVKRSDAVKFHDQAVSIEKKVYVLLNKPKDCVTTSDDPQDRKTVMDFVKDACSERIYPVGRLDRNTTGVLLLTNDGDLASKLTHPKFLKKKIYHVYCDKNVTKADMDTIVSGITLEDGEIHADEISYASDVDKSQVGIEIHSGKNRIVRRIFESLGYRVIKLDRVYFAGLTKKNLRRSEWRYLTEKEVSMLRMGAFE